MAGLFTSAPDGHHLLISATGETVRFSLASGAQVRACRSHPIWVISPIFQLDQKSLCRQADACAWS